MHQCFSVQLFQCSGVASLVELVWLAEPAHRRRYLFRDLGHPPPGKLAEQAKVGVAVPPSWLRHCFNVSLYSD